MPSGSECQRCTARSRTIETATPSVLLRLPTRQQQKPGREETRRAGRWRISPPGYTGGLDRIGRPRRRQHRKNIRFRWPRVRTVLLRNGPDGTRAVDGCPFGAPSCPLPPSAPGRIRAPSRRILAESRHLGAFPPWPLTAIGLPGFTRIKEIPNTPGPWRGVRPFAQSPGGAAPSDCSVTRCSRCLHVAHGMRARPPRIRARVPPGPPRAVLPGVRRPGKAVSLPCAQDPGAYSPPGRTVKTGQ